jgi:hypothetical protein
MNSIPIKHQSSKWMNKIWEHVWSFFNWRAYLIPVMRCAHI